MNEFRDKTYQQLRGTLLFLGCDLVPSRMAANRLLHLKISAPAFWLMHGASRTYLSFVGPVVQCLLTSLPAPSMKIFNMPLPRPFTQFSA